MYFCKLSSGKRWVALPHSLAGEDGLVSDDRLAFLLKTPPVESLLACTLVLDLFGMGGGESDSTTYCLPPLLVSSNTVTMVMSHDDDK